MSVLTREQLSANLAALIGDNADDVALALLDDFSDTFTDMETRVSEAGDWQKKYEENDSAWRTRYKDRFFTGTEELTKKQLEDKPPEDDKPVTFDDLFK